MSIKNISLRLKMYSITHQESQRKFQPDSPHKSHFPEQSASQQSTLTLSHLVYLINFYGDLKKKKKSCIIQVLYALRSRFRQSNKLPKLDNNQYEDSNWNIYLEDT